MTRPLKIKPGDTFPGSTLVTEELVSKQPYKWLCYCDPDREGCGNRKVICTRNLASGNTKSCGCRQKNGLRHHGRSHEA